MYRVRPSLEYISDKKLWLSTVAVVPDIIPYETMVYYKVSVWLVEDHSSLTNTNSPNRRQILTLSEIDFPTYTTTPENFIVHPPARAPLSSTNTISHQHK